MDHHYLLYHDYDPDFRSNQLDLIYGQWTAQGRNKLDCIRREPYFLHVQQERRALDALVLSEPLSQKINNALCIAHSYWTTPEKFIDEEKSAKMQAVELHPELEGSLSIKSSYFNVTEGGVCWSGTSKRSVNTVEIIEDWRQIAARKGLGKNDGHSPTRDTPARDVRECGRNRRYRDSSPIDKADLRNEAHSQHNHKTAEHISPENRDPRTAWYAHGSAGASGQYKREGKEDASTSGDDELSDRGDRWYTGRSKSEGVRRSSNASRVEGQRGRTEGMRAEPKAPNERERVSRHWGRKRRTAMDMTRKGSRRP